MKKKPVNQNPKLWDMYDYNRPNNVKSYVGPRKLWRDCLRYFKWIEKNPVIENKVVTVDGVPTKVKVPHPRAMTIESLCAFLSIRSRLWRHWKKHRPELLPAIEMAEQVIYTQKFEYAAVNLMNATIISRDLSLAEKQELSGPNGGAIEHENKVIDLTQFSDDELKAALKLSEALTAERPDPEGDL